MSAYRVTAPSVQVLMDAETGVFTKAMQGALLPKGADADQVEHMLKLGLIVEEKAPKKSEKD